MALAAFAFASRLALPTWQRFGPAGGDPGYPPAGSEIPRSVRSAPIEDVVDHYLAAVAADAARSVGSKPDEDGPSERTTTDQKPRTGSRSNRSASSFRQSGRSVRSHAKSRRLVSRAST